VSETDKLAADLVDVRVYAAAMGVDEDSVSEVFRDKWMHGRPMRIMKIVFRTYDAKWRFLTGFSRKKAVMADWPGGIWVREDLTQLQQAQTISLNMAASNLSVSGMANDNTARRVIGVRQFALHERIGPGPMWRWRRLARETEEALALANQNGLHGVMRIRNPLPAPPRTTAADGPPGFGQPPQIVPGNAS
jgi:hypothetical protein